MAGKGEEISVTELESQYEMTGNTPAAVSGKPAYDGSGDEPAEGGARPATRTPAAPATPARTPSRADPKTSAEPSEAELEARELSILSRVENDNVALMETEEDLEAERTQRTTPATPETPEGEGDEGEEGEQPAGEARLEGEAQPEGEQPEGDQAVAEWLNNLDPESAQELLDGLLRDTRVKVRYKANGAEQEVAAPELVRRAQSFEGARAVQERLSQAAERERQIAEREQQVETLQQQLQSFQQELVENVDDPDRFATYLTDNSDLDYLKKLRDKLDGAIGEAESNPTAFRLERKVNALTRTLQKVTQPARGEARTRGTPPATREQPPAADAGEVPEDFGFQPGSGYPKAHTGAAWAALKVQLKGSRVTPDQVAQEWAKEGKKRPVHDVAADLLGSRKANGVKAHLAEAPPSLKRGAPSRVTGKGLTKATQATRSRATKFEDIEGVLAKALREAQEAEQG